MGIFGWSYPPGCNSVPGDEPDPPCDVCGLDPSDCICPECPECGENGNLKCYEEHGLVRTQEQIDSKEEVDAYYKAECEREANWGNEYQ